MEWAHHPVTKEFLQELKDSRQDTMEAWAQEKFVGQVAEETAVQNATALGGVRVLDQLIEQIEDDGRDVETEERALEGESHGN